MTTLAPPQIRAPKHQSNRRQQTLWTIGLCAFFLAAIILSTWVIGDAGLSPVLPQRNLPPSLAHPFGTDWLGRDMLTRSLHGMSLSLRVGLLAATVSALIAALLGLAAGTLGGWVDAVICWVIDVCFSLPHLVLLILVAFAVGGGTRGVIIAVALTHWPSLARVVRAEVLQVNSSDYVQLSHRLGRSPAWIARHHMVPHVIPQLLVGLILLFPHAILHEAALSFIGIGISPHLPAIGIILAESMRHLSTGYWWLGVMPGLLLLLSVKAFDWLGENLRALLDPRTSQG
ncbi:MULTISPECIES: ABC transporter permease [Cyanophyceae]|uniref:ABC transporter permease n=1 Tax=Cyanophyceae TaxID=3028117 RepID=UPI0016824060|nr:MULTISPECIES: ABC transporter permease [Cyanophyceae]MBD1918252.1 ABC transporter permease [Phormidium sp. FACHB-77]MBD2031296.1 ABC transporter permease [Phormidium sp. FACHB-322]MBD2052363.1 ABC transporter permease [Leptolyngbya sp. FACHB-60]